MPDNYKIRSYNEDDATRLQEIRSIAFAPVFQAFRNMLGDNIAAFALADLEQQQAAHLDAICSEKSADHIVVAECDDEVCAFCAYFVDDETKVGEIGLNAVHPDSQGAGLGAKLYDYALSHMRDAGMKIATVGTGGDESHASAWRAYEKAGFQKALPSIYLYQAL